MVQGGGMSDLKELEEKIITFVHQKCVNRYGEIIIDCERFWKDYQGELNEPGCRSCIRRKIITKYAKLATTYSAHSNINYKL